MWSCFRKAFQEKGLEEQTIEVMLASIARGTVKQYDSVLKYWWAFCQRRSFNPFRANDKEILSFLTEKFTEKASYGTLNTMRSAIAFINNYETSESSILKRVFKGVFRLRPPAPRYDSIWDAGVAVSFLNNWPTETLDLRKLTFKVTMLLALGSAFRVQSLSLIKINNIKFLDEGIEIRITDLIKTSRPGTKQPYAVFREKTTLYSTNSYSLYRSNQGS